jgi:4-amino-4-deoxy-L-arabinose transferase-like glycosyltransferase
VLFSEVSSLFNLLNNKYFFLLLQLVLLVCLYFFWKKKNTPGLFEPIKMYFRKYSLAEINQSIKSHLPLWLLGFFVIVFYLFGAYLVLKVPPNNYDSMTCHMTRVGFWLQNGNLDSWPTWVVTQKSYPFNAQLQIFWSVLFWGSDLFAGFAQWIAALISILAIYGISRSLGFLREQSLFAILIFSLFPEILLESTTTQNHLLTSSVLMCAFYFLVIGFKENNKVALMFSSLALALALGAHQFAFFLIPGFGLTVLLLWISIRKSNTKLVLFFALSSLAAFLLFGANKYLLNIIDFGNPFYDQTVTSGWAKNTAEYWTPKSVLEWTKNNLERYIFTSLDVTGLPPLLSNSILEIKEDVGVFIFDLTNNPKQQGTFDIYRRKLGVHEDIAWFGVIGFILFYPLMVVQGIKALKMKEPINLGIILTIILYAIIWSGFIIKDGYWSIYSGRFYIIVAMLFAPFISSLYKKEKLISRIFCNFLVLLSIYIAFFVTIFNSSKPLISEWSIWKTDRIQKVYSNARDQLTIIQSVNEFVPTTDSIGILFTKEMFDYPFFGENFDRRIYSIFPDTLLLDEQYLDKISWILICKPVAYEPLNFVKIATFQINSDLTNECNLFHQTDR